MESYIESYLLKFDEINALVTTSFWRADKDDMGNRISQIADDMESILIAAYRDGVKAAGKMLDTNLDVDILLLRDALFQTIDGLDFEDRLIKHVTNHDLEGIQRLAETEYHRMFNAGLFDGASEFEKKNPGQTVKVWNTMRDDRVRNTHHELESVRVGLNDYFKTSDGDTALYPGDFIHAENNVGCRCWITLSRL